VSEHTFPSLNANGLTTSMKAEKKKSNQSKREKEGTTRLWQRKNLRIVYSRTVVVDCLNEKLVYIYIHREKERERYYAI
jgi:hypothetical protein